MSADAAEIADAVLSGHAIQPEWVRTGDQVRDLLEEAADIALSTPTAEEREARELARQAREILTAHRNGGYSGRSSEVRRILGALVETLLPETPEEGEPWEGHPDVKVSPAELARLIAEDESKR